MEQSSLKLSHRLRAAQNILDRLGVFFWITTHSQSRPLELMESSQTLDTDLLVSAASHLRDSQSNLDDDRADLSDLHSIFVTLNDAMNSGDVNLQNSKVGSLSDQDKGLSRFLDSAVEESECAIDDLSMTDADGLMQDALALTHALYEIRGEFHNSIKPMVNALMTTTP